MGIFCARVLRVYHINYIEKISTKYIVQRWTKAVVCSKVHKVAGDYGETMNIVPATVWRNQMIWDFVRVVNFSQGDLNVRKFVDSVYDYMKKESKWRTYLVKLISRMRRIQVKKRLQMMVLMILNM